MQRGLDMKQLLKVLGICALALPVAAPQIAAADGATSARFSVSIRGLTAGDVAIEGEETAEA